MSNSMGPYSLQRSKVDDKFTASRQRVNLCVYIHTSTVEGVLYKQWRLCTLGVAFHLGLHCL